MPPLSQGVSVPPVVTSLLSPSSWEWASAPAALRAIHPGLSRLFSEVDEVVEAGLTDIQAQQRVEPGKHKLQVPFHDHQGSGRNGVPGEGPLFQP